MTAQLKRVRIPHLREMKARGRKIVMLTVYDATMARLMDHTDVDVFLVGDSLGMVIMGCEDTIPVTLDAMVHHTRAVARATRHALVVADMPFLTYQVSVAEALRNAGRLIQEGGAAAVKIEGGTGAIEVAQRLVEAGIPVMGHLGLLPQHVHQVGGFRKQGTSERDAEHLLRDARDLEQAGVFAIVLESIPHALAGRVTEAVSVPTIGIGAGPHCDGQVLVSYDMLGLSGDSTPPFAKQYADLGRRITEAADTFAAD
ncbi:MAG: 3-methyl-2-oxobutanoate hydroxymethyltransferase, partial [Phycisphaerales bacterium]|nr:3-methyl-2-oxobutanoate hydroxymethyltransferase [Phycisphaerales bacterium]